MHIPRIIRYFLLPLSWIYGIIVAVRNFFFDKGWLKSHTFAIPTICVGNITVGGTGKTPHVEYLANILRDVCIVSVVSRGYRRKTRGITIATENTTAKDIGDEPFQIKRNCPFAHVVVNANRCKAIKALLSPNITHPIGVVLLDDAFQHRYVSAGLNILLTDYNHPMFADYLLPAGLLREQRSNVSRTDMLIVTKCPANLIEKESMAFATRSLTTGKTKISPKYGVFFTTMTYSEPYKVFGGDTTTFAALSQTYSHVIALAAIAHPEPFVREIARRCNVIGKMIYSDHHAFTRTDIAHIEDAVAKDKQAVIITTEKDAARLVANSSVISDELRKRVYALPMKVKFLFGKDKEFNNKIIDYVRKHQSDGRISPADN